jgi:hypothetical protein
MLSQVTVDQIAAAKQRAERVENPRSLHYHPNRRTARKNMAELIREHRNFRKGRNWTAKANANFR